MDHDIGHRRFDVGEGCLVGLAQYRELGGSKEKLCDADGSSPQETPTFCPASPRLPIPPSTIWVSTRRPRHISRPLASPMRRPSRRSSAPAAPTPLPVPVGHPRPLAAARAPRVRAPARVQARIRAAGSAASWGAYSGNVRLRRLRNIETPGPRPTPSRTRRSRWSSGRPI